MKTPSRIEMGRFATLMLAVIGGGTALTGCDDRVIGLCDGTNDEACAQDEGEGPAPTARPVLPAGYQVTWSKCTHFIEGDAKVLNNSRVVRVASDGTIPLQRVEPVSNPRDNLRRVIASRVPNKLIGGEGVLREAAPRGGVGQVVLALGAGAPRAPEKVAFVKLGQTVATREADDSIVLWAVSSEQLGEPVMTDDGKLAYQDTCFRNPNLAGRDTMGYPDGPGNELADACLVETMLQTYNANSAYGELALVNWADMKIPSANDPSRRPLPDVYATYLGEDNGMFWYTGYGAGLNDINGAERDVWGAYYGLDIYCHVVISGGFQVPGAKRPATKSLPPPGQVDGKSLIAWRPVNVNLTIANSYERVAGEHGIWPELEPAPEPAEVPVDADAIVPM